MKNLFIFGAGASKSAGAPLMNNFFTQGEKLFNNGIIGNNGSHFREIIDIFSDFQNLYQKSNLSLNNFEEFLGIIEMGFIIDKVPDSKMSSIDTLRESLNKFIVQTIERSMPFKRDIDNIYPVRPYDIFTKALKHLNENDNSRNRNEFSFITFNYDLALDHALMFNGFGINYHLIETKGVNQGSPLLKLHGSINWGLCQKCGKIIPSDIKSAPFGRLTKNKRAYYDLGSNINKIKHCDKPLKNTPLIIPPTWNKTQYHGAVSSVWKKASKELALAENIFIIGYSLPESDMFFRYLYSLGVYSRTIIKNLIVINPDLAVKEKFEKLFGGLALKNYQFIANPFEPAIDTIVQTISSA